MTIRFRLHFFEKHEMPSVAAYEEPTERARTEIASPRQEAKAKGEEQLTAEEFKRPPEYDADGYEEAAEGARALDALDMAEAVEFSATERQAQLQGGEEEETLLLPRAPPKPHTAAVEALPSKKRTIGKRGDAGRHGKEWLTVLPFPRRRSSKAAEGGVSGDRTAEVRR